MPSVSPRQDRPRTGSRLWFAFLVFCSIVLSLALWLRPAHATCPPTGDIKEYCESRPEFRIAHDTLRAALVAKCEGEWRRRCGLDPFSAGGVPSAESAGGVPPVESAKNPVDKKIPAPPRKPEAQASSSRPNSGIPAAGENRFVPGEVLVELRPDVSPQTADVIAKRERLRLLASQRLALIGTTMYRYRIEGKRSVAAIVAPLEADARIAAVQPNYLYTLQSEPTGGLAAAQYVIPKMRVTEAHAISNGAKTLVAVIDSGIDRNHPEISNAVKDSFDPGGANGEPAVHGTAVAGIIAAHAELTGVAPQARILAVRAFGGTDAKAAARGTTYDIVAGIEWSELHGARIVNMSFAGPPDPDLSRELADGAHRGVIFIAPVGNEGRSAKPLYPAAYENVIAVTATDRSDGVFKDANRCPATCVAAPGVDVLVAEPGDAYGFLSGTSMAAAHVSGVVALLLDVKPDLELKVIRDLLSKTAKHLNAGDPDQASVAGIVDAFESLKAASAPVAIELSAAGEVQAASRTLKVEPPGANSD
jgi:subtilisin family serine protease